MQKGEMMKFLTIFFRFRAEFGKTRRMADCCFDKWIWKIIKRFD